MDQQWFEMNDIHRRRLEGAVWIPLREQREDRAGKYGYAGFHEEYVSIATLAVPIQARDRLDDLTVSNLVTNGWGHYGAVEDSAYVQADVYDHYGRFSGIHLVLEQNFNGLEDPREWYVHQDLVLTLGLKREQDVWVRPAEGYETVLRETRVDGRPNLFQIRSSHLKDYLCAREMGLVVVTTEVERRC